MRAHLMPPNPTRKQIERVGVIALRDARDATEKARNTIEESRRIIRRANEVLAKEPKPKE